MPELRFEQGVWTHVGAVRRVNEDAHVARPRDGLWMVADGMGGHRHGEWASATIAAAIHAAKVPDAIGAAVEAVEGAILAANRSILAEADAIGGTMGSTVAALLVRPSQFVALWVGDSRIYRCRDDEIVQLTTDHSQVEDMIAAGLLDRADAEHHPMAHILLRAVGTRKALQVDRIEGSVVAGDVFLLCSDGLSRLVEDGELARIISGTPPAAAAASLIELALARGAPDNVTVAVIGCDATTLVGLG